jgi:hypothetical protein
MTVVGSPWMSPRCSPMVGRPLPICRSCARCRRYSGRWPRIQPRGGCWTASTRRGWLGCGPPAPRPARSPGRNGLRLAAACPPRGRPGGMCRAWFWIWMRPLWCVTRRRRTPHPPGRKPLGCIRCSVSWTTPVRPCPGCCARAGPGRIPPPITSPSSMPLWRRFPTPTATAARS